MKRVLAAAAGLLAAASAQAETVVVTADRMIDVERGRIVDRPTIVVRDGRIAAVHGAGADVAVPADAKRVALPGMTLLPGLIDMHVHLDGSPTYGGYRGYEFTDSFGTAIGVAHAKRTLEAGFTTVRNVGALNYADVGIRQAIEEGFVPGPRIVTAAYAIGATGGHCDETFLPPSYNARSPALADTPEEGRKRVRELRKYGAQVIKICATGGVFSRNTEPGVQQLTLPEMQAIVEEAHMAGLKVAAHAHGAAGIRDAIRAGVDTIELASLIVDEGIKLARERGAYLSMDIYNSEYTQSEGKKNGVLEDNLRKDREIADVQRENFRKAVKAGVQMVYGTDAGVHPHGDNAKQFAWMVRYGLTPMQAIQSATLTAAKALGREKDVGALAVGRYADLIAVAGDPLADIRVLETVGFVMKGGEVVKDARNATVAAR